jgi:sugar porter (SP) family MFS transporter
MMGAYGLLCAIAVALGGFVFGFDASVISGTIGLVSRDFALDDWQVGFLVASPTLGAVMASLVAGTLADIVGRKKVLIAIAFLYVLSAFASAWAPSYAWLVLGRFIGGLAFASLILAPIYIAEIAPADARGRLVSINQLNIVVGFSAAYFCNFAFLQLSRSGLDWVHALGIDVHTWRWMLGAGSVPAVIYFLLLFFVPESPRWLVMQHQDKRGRAVLERLLPRLSGSEIELQLDEIRATAAVGEDGLRGRFGQLFGPKVRYALIVGLIVGVAQQITGVNAVYFYAPVIFEQSGVGTNAAFAQAIWVGVINVLFTVVAMTFIDRWGRKPLLVVGLAGVFVSMSICAWGFSQARYQLSQEDVQGLATVVESQRLEPLVGRQFNSDVEFKQAMREVLGDAETRKAESALIQAAIQINPVLVLLGILGFVASFAVSLGPVMWVLFSEIFPNRLRGLAISFVGVINSAVSFTVQLVFPRELSILGAATTFLIYGIFALIGLCLVLWLLPETRQKSLEEIEAEFARRAVGGRT